MLIGLTFALAGPLRENSPPGIYATELTSVAPAIKAVFTLTAQPIVAVSLSNLSDVTLEQKGGLESRIEYDTPLQGIYSKPFINNNGDYDNFNKSETNPNEVKTGYLNEPNRTQARAI